MHRALPPTLMAFITTLTFIETLLFPILRKIAAPALYRAKKGNESAVIRKYVRPAAITSGSMEPKKRRSILWARSKHSTIIPRPKPAAMDTNCPALRRASAGRFAPKNWLVMTAPPVARAANRFRITLLIISTRETPEIAASPTEDTITPSHIPTRAARACSITRGKIRRSSIRLVNSSSFCNFTAFTCKSFF